LLLTSRGGAGISPLIEDHIHLLTSRQTIVDWSHGSPNEFQILIKDSSNGGRLEIKEVLNDGNEQAGKGFIQIRAVLD
jgi:hypothetical protein